MSMPRFLLERFIAGAIIASCWALPVQAQSGLRNTPAGFCAITSLGSATKITTTNCVFGSFTGVIAGTTLTVSALTGSLVPGQLLVGTGIPAGTWVQSQQTGTTGLAGNYTLSYPQGTTTLTVGSEAMTTAGVPVAAGYALICAYVQAVNYRDDPTPPTATPGTGGQGLVPASSTIPTCIGYNGTFTNLQFFQQSGGAILGISFYQ